MSTRMSNATTDCVVLIAASYEYVNKEGNKQKRWGYYMLKPGGDSQGIVEDPDVLCVYDSSTRDILDVLFGKSSNIWRIHDGTQIRVQRDGGTKVVSLVRIKGGLASDPHTCTGTWPLCKENTLTLTAAGLEFPTKLAGTTDVNRSGNVFKP